MSFLFGFDRRQFLEIRLARAFLRRTVVDREDLNELRAADAHLRDATDHVPVAEAEDPHDFGGDEDVLRGLLEPRIRSRRKPKPLGEISTMPSLSIAGDASRAASSRARSLLLALENRCLRS